MKLTVSVARTTMIDNSIMSETTNLNTTFVIDVVEEGMVIILAEVMGQEGEVLEGDIGEEETSVVVAGVVEEVDVIMISTTNLKNLNLKSLTSLEIDDVICCHLVLVHCCIAILCHTF